MPSSLSHRSSPSVGIGCFVVIGESSDSGSDAKLGQVLRDAELGNISVYTIAVTSIGANTAANDILGGKLPPLKMSHLPPISARRPGPDTIGGPYLDYITPAIWLIERGTSEIKNHQLEVAVAATGGVHYRAFRDDTIRRHSTKSAPNSMRNIP